jgi:hypothetical protein
MIPITTISDSQLRQDLRQGRWRLAMSVGQRDRVLRILAACLAIQGL